MDSSSEPEATKRLEGLTATVVTRVVWNTHLHQSEHTAERIKSIEYVLAGHLGGVVGAIPELDLSVGISSHKEGTIV